MGYEFDPQTKAFFHTDIHESIPEGCISVSDEVYKSVMNRPIDHVIAIGQGGQLVTMIPVLTTEELWSRVQEWAQGELLENDKVATRCWKAGVSYPAEWLAYDESLRSIVRSQSGDPDMERPTKPAYPEGT